MKFKKANTYTIQCMGQSISLKSERNNPWFNILLHTYTINCVCHSIRSVFRVLGMYNFGLFYNSGLHIAVWKKIETNDVLTTWFHEKRIINFQNFFNHFLTSMSFSFSLNRTILHCCVEKNWNKWTSHLIFCKLPNSILNFHKEINQTEWDLFIVLFR